MHYVEPCFSIYNISISISGISGLEELEGLDPVFTDYTNSLFNLSSQSWERALHNTEVNQRLDETLERFLVQLSPYFLLKCSHKALEWLIYRWVVDLYI